MSEVHDPLTPDQAKAQVVDAAKEIVSTLNLKVERAWVSLSSCNDQGEAPFRGEVTIHYPPSSGIADDREKTAAMVQKLTAAGWTGDADFHSHAPNLHKGGVTAVLYGQGPGMKGSVLEILGECRDVTSTKEVQGKDEPLDLS